MERYEKGKIILTIAITSFPFNVRKKSAVSIRKQGRANPPSVRAPAQSKKIEGGKIAKKKQSSEDCCSDYF